MSDHTVLIVEDSPTMRQLIAFSLKRLRGIKVVEANDGVDALKKLAAGPIDLIFTDINMPIMDGLKLVSLIRSDASFQHIPVVIITTEGAQEDRERGLSLGANDYITKPIQTARILDVAKSLLNLT
jgi:two-component system, chemotaxis family, chemotaxis protein CheY